MTEKFGVLRVDPKFCPHEHTVFIRAGGFYTISGEADDNCESYAQCLDCGAVKRDDGTWGMTLNNEEPEKDKLAF